MNRYTFDDGMQITANNDKEADLIYNDIIINRHNGDTRPFEELDKLAMKYYNANDDKAFYYFSDDELALLWSKCMFTNSHPFGQAYDDEVFDTISSLPSKDEIFAKAEEYADEEEKNFKGKPFFKTESLKENMTIEDMFKDVGVKIVFDDKGHFTKEAEEKYDEVAKKFFGGNQDKLDKLCDEEKCFDESLKESDDCNAYSYKSYTIINDANSSCWRIKDKRGKWIGNCFSTDDEAEEFIDSKNESLKEDIETPYFKAFITNLGKYNEGELVGEWVEFPIDEDDFNEVLKKIGVSDEPDADGNYYEEFFVTDYDCNLNGFNWQDFGEYPSYDTLQEFGELIESIDDVEAVDNAYEVTGDLKEAIDGLEDGSIIYYPGIHSESDLGYEIIAQIYGDDIPKDTLDSYFDYEALGRDLGFDEYENSEYDDFDMEEATKEYIDDYGYDEIKELDEFIDFKEMGEYLYDGDEDLTDEQYIEYAKNYVKENGYDDAEDYIDFDSLGEWLKDNSLIDVPEQYISAGEYWCGDEYASDYDIGHAYVEEVGPGGVANPENYFDYESFGRDLTFENFTLTSDGAIEQI